jgi:hypothetical protein
VTHPEWGTDKNGFHDKEPSVMETHIDRFHRGDAHDKTECRFASWLPRLLPRSLFLPGIMGKKFAAQTESCLVDEKVHHESGEVQSLPRYFGTALINEIDAENGALILSAGNQRITAFAFSLLRQGQSCRGPQEYCRVAERVRDDERFLGLARLGLDPHTVSG